MGLEVAQHRKLEARRGVVVGRARARSQRTAHIGRDAEAAHVLRGGLVERDDDDLVRVRVRG